MIALVKYVDYHWDNHQGGSGKSFEMFAPIEIPEDLKAKDIVNFVVQSVTEKAKRERPYQQREQISIQEIRIVEPTQTGGDEK